MRWFCLNIWIWSTLFSGGANLTPLPLSSCRDVTPLIILQKYCCKIWLKIQKLHTKYLQLLTLKKYTQYWDQISFFEELNNKSAHILKLFHFHFVSMQRSCVHVFFLFFLLFFWSSYDSFNHEVRLIEESNITSSRTIMFWRFLKASSGANQSETTKSVRDQNLVISVLNQ